MKKSKNSSSSARWSSGRSAAAKKGAFSVHVARGAHAPRLEFGEMKDAVLGSGYSLSLAFITPRESRRLNRVYRKKDKPANVLSFPLSKTSGEILIDLATARRQAPEFGATPRQFAGWLFIHGLFHLRGFAHGSRMDRAELRVRTRFHLA